MLFKIKKLPSYIITERSITKKENVTLLYNVDDYSLVKDAIDALKMKIDILSY